MRHEVPGPSVGVRRRGCTGRAIETGKSIETNATFRGPASSPAAARGEPLAGAILRSPGGICRHSEPLFAQAERSLEHPQTCSGSQRISLTRKRPQVQILYRPLRPRTSQPDFGMMCDSYCDSHARSRLPPSGMPSACPRGDPRRGDSRRRPGPARHHHHRPPAPAHRAGHHPAGEEHASIAGRVRDPIGPPKGAPGTPTGSAPLARDLTAKRPKRSSPAPMKIISAGFAGAGCDRSRR